jgi:hypothetical protein
MKFNLKKNKPRDTGKMKISHYLVQMPRGGMNWYGLPSELRIPHLQPFGGIQPRKNGLGTHQTTVISTAFHQKLFGIIQFTQVAIVTSP